MAGKLVQMSGVPGSGKSSVASALVRERGFVSLDHDTVKSSLLDAGLPFNEAGSASYTVLFAVTQDLLRQKQDVVIDSPCFHNDVLRRGNAAARHHSAVYAVIECITADIDIINLRLKSRSPLRSQRPSVEEGPRDLAKSDLEDGKQLFGRWISGMKRPSRNYLQLDTSGNLDLCCIRAIEFVDSLMLETTV